MRHEKSGQKTAASDNEWKVNSSLNRDDVRILRLQASRGIPIADLAQAFRIPENIVRSVVQRRRGAGRV